MDEQSLNRVNGDRVQSRQVDELIGLARGLIADGSINPLEVEFLERWLVANLAVRQQPLISTLYHRVREVLTDGVVDAEECNDLLAALTALTAGDTELGEASKSTSLPLCNPLPAIVFAGKTYAFTGTFNYGQRKHCESVVAARGAFVGALTNRTEYLVIGAYATESWKHSSFGNKILKAVEMRRAGFPISIIAEEHWARHI